MAAVRSFLAAVALTATAVTVGVAVRGEAGATGQAPSKSRPGTPLSAYDTTGVVVLRTAFCVRVPGEAVAAALGGEPDSSSSYTNGEPAELTGRLKDVSHEFSCSWVGTDGTVARAWVFAPPVTPARARDLVDEAVTARGCRSLDAAPPFGSPTAAALCRSGTGLQVSYRGLFGDAWLTCSIAAPASGTERAELTDRTGRWCVAVARAASDRVG
ncbi:hypothetical protein [Nocardioides sp.]|jgi:hypothetical protein|uniref:hypothetical protein n=1 Tax=Nocardioides sp. TaxID=35761 RepID=UPI0031FF0F8D|nr:hypothetical protein [Nocardioides sp.]